MVEHKYIKVISLPTHHRGESYNQFKLGKVYKIDKIVDNSYVNTVDGFKISIRNGDVYGVEGVFVDNDDSIIEIW